MKTFVAMLLVLLCSTCEAQLFRRPFSGCGNPACAMCYPRAAVRRTTTMPLQPRAAQDSQAPTPLATVRAMVDELRLSERDVFVDLGCGDGRVAVEVAKRFWCRCYGVDTDPQKVEQAKSLAAREQVSLLCRFYRGDLHDVDLSEVSVVYVYLDDEALERLAPKLRSQRSLIVVSHQHRIPGLQMRPMKVRGMYYWRSDGD